MNFKISTQVPGNYRVVLSKFDRQLFEALIPSIGKMEIVKFTGSETGDQVHLRFLSPIKADWISDITEHGVDENKAWFVDQGVQVPKPLRLWKHQHIVEHLGEDSSIIIDDITYKTGWLFLDLLIFPMLYLSFYPRKKIYKKYFRK